MTYRDASEARRAEIESLEEQLRRTESDKTELATRAEREHARLVSRLERAERALASYREGRGVLELLGRPWITSILLLSAGLFAFAIVLRLEKFAYEADTFAKTSVVLSVFATFSAWRAAGQTQIGLVSTLVKAAIAGIAADKFGAFRPTLGQDNLIFFSIVPTALLLVVFLERVWLLRLTEAEEIDPPKA